MSIALQNATNDDRNVHLFDAISGKPLNDGKPFRAFTHSEKYVEDSFHEFHIYIGFKNTLMYVKRLSDNVS